MAELRQHIQAAPVGEVRLSDVKRSAMRRRRIRRGGAPAALGIVAAIGLLVVRPLFPSGGTPAGDGPKPSEPTPTANAQCISSGECFPVRDDEGWTLDAQARLAPFAKSIHAAADNEPGFGDMTYTYDPEGLVLRWAGDVPDGVIQAVESARSEGVVVTIVPVAYGSEALLRLSVQVADGLLAEGVEFASVGSSVDGSAIEVHGIDGPDPSVCSASVERARMMEIAAAIAGDVPVRCGADELPSYPL